MPRIHARYLMALLPLAVLAGCGGPSAREVQLAKELEQAKAEIQAAGEAKAKAERSAALARAQSAGSMSDFYGDSEGEDDGEAMDPSPDGGDDNTVNRGPGPAEISAADPGGAPEIGGEGGPQVPPGA